MARPMSVDMSDTEVRNQVETFGKLIATHEEMAHILGVTVRTIENYMADEEGEFFRVYKKAAGEAKQSLRRKQMAVAEEGNPTILVWLGKQLLDQKDKTETDMNLNMSKELAALVMGGQMGDESY